MKHSLAASTLMTIAVLGLFFGATAAQQQLPPLKFCRTQSGGGLFERVDVFMQQGFTYWKDWINARGGIKVSSNGERRLVELKVYEDGSNDETKLLLYQRILTLDNCDFILPTFAPPTTGVKLMQMIESGTGAIDTFLPVKRLPYLYRHGGNAGILWQGRNWTWSFSMSPSEQNRPRPCFKLYQEAGAKSAWIIVTGELAGYNETGIAAQKLLSEYGINQTQVISIDKNLTGNALNNFTLALAQANPDLVLFRLETTQLLANILRTMRSFARYEPRGIHNLGDNQLNNGSKLFEEAGWALNHTTASGSWSGTTTLFSDQYYGTAADLTRNISARFPNAPVNELHAAAATIGLLHVIAIEETESTDPDTIRQFFRTFNRTLSYGPISWIGAGEFSSAAWQCQQTSDNQTVRVLQKLSDLVYPAIAIEPPEERAKNSDRTDKRTRNILIIVFSCVLVGLFITAVTVYLGITRYNWILIVRKSKANTDEWGT